MEFNRNLQKLVLQWTIIDELYKDYYNRKVIEKGDKKVVIKIGLVTIVLKKAESR